MSTLNPDGELIVLEDPQPTRGPRQFNWWRIVGYITLLVFTILYLYPLLMLLSTALKTLPEYPPVQGGKSFDMSNVVDEFVKKGAPVTFRFFRHRFWSMCRKSTLNPGPSPPIGGPRRSRPASNSEHVSRRAPEYVINSWRGTPSAGCTRLGHNSR